MLQWLIPPLSGNGKIVTDFKEKANLFNKCFLTLPNLSKLLENQNILQKQNYHNYHKIRQTFDINKAHGHDDVSNRMLKVCDKSIVKRLSIILKTVNRKRPFLISGKSPMLFQFKKKKRRRKRYHKKLSSSFTITN